jgi:hypothetical protein
MTLKVHFLLDMVRSENYVIQQDATDVFKSIVRFSALYMG